MNYCTPRYFDGTPADVQPYWAWQTALYATSVLAWLIAGALA